MVTLYVELATLYRDAGIKDLRELAKLAVEGACNAMTMQLKLTQPVTNYYDVCVGIYLQGEPDYYYISYILEGETIVYVDHALPLHIKTLLPLVLRVIGKSYTELSQAVSTYNLIYS